MPMSLERKFKLPAQHKSVLWVVRFVPQLPAELFNLGQTWVNRVADDLKNLLISAE